MWITVIYVLFELSLFFPIVITMPRTYVVCRKGWALVYRQSDRKERKGDFLNAPAREVRLNLHCVTLPSQHSLVWFWVNVTENVAKFHKQTAQLSKQVRFPVLVFLDVKVIYLNINTGKTYFFLFLCILHKILIYFCDGRAEFLAVITAVHSHILQKSF